MLGNNGRYDYSLAADFNNPIPTITVGNGTVDYENDLIADPSTSITFNSSEIDNYRSNRYLWNEAFNSLDSSYMNHNYYPDGFSSTWSMDPLNMYNQFPTKISNENWDNWNLNYDPIQTLFRQHQVFGCI